jgi:hypothetical protein
MYHTAVSCLNFSCFKCLIYLSIGIFVFIDIAEITIIPPTHAYLNKPKFHSAHTQHIANLINASSIYSDKVLFSAHSMKGMCHSARTQVNKKPGKMQCCGSGIWCLFDPWILDPGWVKNPDPDPG